MRGCPSAGDDDPRHGTKGSWQTMNAELANNRIRNSGVKANEQSV
jgi:hypothetical protein